jgi:hypothetical protein
MSKPDKPAQFVVREVVRLTTVGAVVGEEFPRPGSTARDNSDAGHLKVFDLTTDRKMLRASLQQFRNSSIGLNEGVPS